MVKFQLLDADYFSVGNKPVVRLFGRTASGSAVCAMVHNFFPYFYAELGAEEKLKENRAVRKTEPVEKVPVIGFQEKRKMLKVTMNNPKDVPFIRDMLEQKGIKTYEADVLFKYRFLVDNGIRGMEWIDAAGAPAKTNVVSVPALQCTGIKKAEEPENAPLRYLSVDVECLIGDMTRTISYENDPIIIISIAFEPEFRNKKTLVLLAKPFTDHGAVGFPGEKEMLEHFLHVVEEYDPDIITGYNIVGFDLPYILTRLKKHNLFQSFGRVKDKPVFCREYGFGKECIVPGRAVVDPFQLLKRDVYIRLHKYTLDNVARVMLNDKKEDVAPREMAALWGKAEGIKRLISYGRKDAELALRLLLEKNMLDKFFELSKISGLLLQDALGGQTMRIETRILHELYGSEFVVPNKPDKRELAIRMKKKDIKGAMVLEPEKGLHADHCTLVLDFQSLYPSIIMSYNVSPDCLVVGDAKDVKTTKSPLGPLFVDKAVRKGVLPRILEELTATRKRVKADMKKASGEERKRLDAKQLAIKILGNSVYGYSGYVRSRLYTLDVANAITAYGRENIMRTKDVIESNFNVSVIYMDTDSAFIKTDTNNLDEAHALGEKIAAFVTNSLKGELVLEFEKIYRTFLILTKKRYAGWKFVFENGKWVDGIEMKGIETVRRDWCPLVSETLEIIINTILKEGDIKKAVETLRRIAIEVKNNAVPLEKLAVVKGITKGVKSYEGIQPHIELAKRIQARDPQAAPMIGDRISYVILKGNDILSRRAEDPNYVKEKKLQIDANYYINSQLLPPVERILGAMGITKSEIIGNGRQTSFSDLFSGSKRKMKHDIVVNGGLNSVADETKSEAKENVLDGVEGFVCRSCHKAHRRLPLSGRCTCGGEVLMSFHGSVSNRCVVK